jgi:DtxR family transcriptional regulator, Mn-dependent transcriptional regulator
MMIHPVADEVLERLWTMREEGRASLSREELRLPNAGEEVEAALNELAASRSIRLGERIELLEAGAERGRGIVRRHRLAEILFTEVLAVDLHDAEASACEFEHMLSERVVDRVCTFLGHPPKCPHGQAIPQGSCCHKFERKVDPLIMRLYDLPISAAGKIVFIAPKSAARLNRLATLGVLPGTDIRLLQRKPSIVIDCGETSIALEEEIAYEIYVRPVMP